MKVLALMKYGDKAASTRQRLLQFRQYFSEGGIEITFSPLLNNDYLERTFSGYSVPVFSVIEAYISRILILLRSNKFDMIWIHSESFPYLPGMIELLAKLYNKPIVYDCDDAIFHHYELHPRPLIRRFLGRKLEPLLSAASACVCGNAYLKAYADRFCRRAEIIPTVVDTSVYLPAAPPQEAPGPLVIGWIGSPSTWNYVRPLVPLLERLADELHLVVRIIGAGPQHGNHPRFEFVEWSEESEIRSIQGIDIGIMPLPDDPFARGKCGYKLIQYMACGIPVIASPVGVNTEIVDDGVNGYLASDEAQWDAAICDLSKNRELRALMGARGREKVVENYSLQVQGPRLVALLQEVAGRREAID